MRRTMRSPRPDPDFLVVRKGSNSAPMCSGEIPFPLSEMLMMISWSVNFVSMLIWPSLAVMDWAALRIKL